MKNVTILLLGFFFCGMLLSQTISLQSATKQSWAGGQCCSHGVNYVFGIKAGLKPNTFKLDSLWVGGSYFVPREDDYGSLQIDWDTVSNMYIVYANESHNDAWRGGPLDYDVDPEPITPPYKVPHYQGEALIVYHLNGRKRRLAVPSLTELPPIAYP